MRKTYLDNLRWLTVLTVLVYHAIYLFNGVTVYGVLGPLGTFQPQDAFLYIVYPWFMFLLFVVSGMAARFELETKGEQGFLRRRTGSYLVPSTVGLFVFWWILGYYNLQVSGALEGMRSLPKALLYLILSVSGVGPLWYLQMLWLFSLLLIPLRKLGKDRLYRLGAKATLPVFLLLAIPVYGSAQILNVPVVTVYRFGIYGFGFLLGYVLFSHEEVMERLEGYRWLFAVLAVVSCVAFVTVYWGKSYADHTVLDTPLCNVFAWFATLAILALMKHYGNVRTPFSQWMCRKSFGFYVFHYLPMVAVAWYLKPYAAQLPAVVLYLAVAVSGLGGALLLYELFRRIPLLRWCLLGITTEKTRPNSQ